MEKRDALFRVEQDLCEGLVPEHLAQDHARVERYLLVLVRFERGEDDLGLGGDVVDGGPSGFGMWCQWVWSVTRERNE